MPVFPYKTTFSIIKVIYFSLFFGIGYTLNAQSTFISARGGPNDDICTSVCKLDDGRYVVVSNTQSIGAGSVDIYIEYFDSSFVRIDSFTIGNSLADTPSRVAAIDSEIVIVGGSDPPSVSAPWVCSAQRINGRAIGWGREYYRWNNSINVGALADLVISGDTIFTVGGLRLSCNGCSNTDFVFLIIDANTGNLISQNALDRYSESIRSIDISSNKRNLFTLGGSSNGSGFRQVVQAFDRSANLNFRITYGNIIGLPKKIKSLNANAYILMSEATNPGPTQSFLGIIDSLGNPISGKVFEHSSGVSTIFQDFTLIGDSIYFVGHIDRGSSSTFRDGILMATDTMGNFGWAKAFVGQDDDYFNAIEATPNGFLLVGGTNSSGIGGYDQFYVKTDKSGSVSVNPGACWHVESVVLAQIDTTLQVVPNWNFSPLGGIISHPSSIYSPTGSGFSESTCAVLVTAEIGPVVGNWVGRTVEIQWEDKLTGNSTYSVYRSSNGIQFNLMAKDLEKNSWTDRNLGPESEYFYKVQAINNGGIYNSKVLCLKNKNSIPLAIAWLPNEDCLLINGLQEGIYTLELGDMNGKILLDRTISGEKGSQLPVKGLAGGIYWVRIAGQGENYHGKLFIEK